MNKKFQNLILTKEYIKTGETPYMTEKTVFSDLLKSHSTPKDKYGHIVVSNGELKFFWEDDLENPILINEKNSIVIIPEKNHHIVIENEVNFKIEFYKKLD